MYALKYILFVGLLSIVLVVISPWKTEASPLQEYRGVWLATDSCKFLIIHGNSIRESAMCYGDPKTDEGRHPSPSTFDFLFSTPVESVSIQQDSVVFEASHRTRSGTEHYSYQVSKSPDDTLLVVTKESLWSDYLGDCPVHCIDTYTYRRATSLEYLSALLPHPIF